MIPMAHEPLTQEEGLLQGFLALEAPEGFRAELIDGEIAVTPPPGGDHEKCIWKIARQITVRCATEFDFSGNKGLVVPSDGRKPMSHVIPDATFAPADIDFFGGAAPWTDPDGVVLVVEVTSDRPERDRVAKRRGYAAAEIPLFLLVDREEEKVTLYSGPADRDYEHTDSVPFGKALALPEPFGFELDTSQFA